MTPEVLTEAEVRALSAALPDTRVQTLIRSHERLRAMFDEAAVRLAKQSDLLSKRAERPDLAADLAAAERESGYGDADV